MKKLILILITFTTIHFNGFAQQNDNKHSLFQLSFMPPLSTHGTAAAEYTNKVSFNILAGISRNEETFTFGGLANIIYYNANGFQFAGLCNYTGHDGRGMMFSGLTNLISNTYTGFLFSGLANTTQAMKGFQFAGLTNISGNIKGFQFAGLGNIANDVNGFQFGGLFNIAKKVSGVQFAGLVNIAENGDYPLALLNILKNGEYMLGITYNEIGSTMLTLRSGGRVTYGILGIGYNHKANGDGISTEGGIGAHINIAKWLQLNHEIKTGSTSNFSNKSTFYTNYALLPTFRLTSHIQIFGGPSINYLNSNNLNNEKMFPSHSLWKKYSDSNLQQIYIGYQVGVQYKF